MPKGWHIPNNEEWLVLIIFLDGENYAGSKMKRSDDWKSSEENNNSSGFTALPGGYRNEE